MYAKIENKKIIKFPYGLGELATDNPNVSFPKEISDALLADFNIVKVEPTEAPEVDIFTERLETTVEATSKGWKQVWNVVQAPREDVEIIIKQQRNSKLAATDWRFRSDMTTSQEWVDYCQALRDITDSKGYPYAVVWPTEPGQ